MRVEPKDLFTSEKAVWLRGVPMIKGETEASEASTGMTSGQCCQCACVSFLVVDEFLVKRFVAQVDEISGWAARYFQRNWCQESNGSGCNKARW